MEKSYIAETYDIFSDICPLARELFNHYLSVKANVWLQTKSVSHMLNSDNKEKGALFNELTIYNSLLFIGELVNTDKLLLESYGNKFLSYKKQTYYDDKNYNNNALLYCFYDRNQIKKGLYKFINY